MAKKKVEKKARVRKNTTTGGAVANAAAKASGGGGNYAVNLPEEVNRIELKKGSMDFDIIPYKVTKDGHPDKIQIGKDGIDRRYSLHYGFGDEGKQPIVCRESIGEPCPVCEMLAKGKKDGTLTKEVAQAFKKKDRALFNVYNEDTDEVEILDYTIHGFHKQLYKEVAESTDDDVKYFAELEQGYTVEARFSEEPTGGSGKWLCADRIDFAEREDIDAAIMEQSVNLDDCLNILSYEEISDKLYGSATDEDDVEDIDEDDVEDVEEDDVEDVEEVVEKPKRKGKNKKKKPEPEPEPEDEDDDEDEDEECPVDDGEFGEDFGVFPECEDCPNKEACDAALED